MRNETTGSFDRPRSMRLPEIRAARLEALYQPHMAPLTEFVHQLRQRDSNEYPFFDPADGGINASILFLLEKPGPMTVPAGRGLRQGSGFISRDNNDPTAEAAFAFHRAAGIPRSETLMWNVIPGWNGTIKVTAAELAAGVQEVAKLIGLLPRLRTIVLVGGRAAKAETLIRSLGDYVVHRSAHPSPQVKVTRREMWDRIPDAWAEAWRRTTQARNTVGPIGAPHCRRLE